MVGVGRRHVQQARWVAVDQPRPVVVGALCGALATQTGLLGRIATVAIGVGAAIALAGEAFMQTQYLNADRVRNRVRARAVSEKASRVRSISAWSVSRPSTGRDLTRSSMTPWRSSRRGSRPWPGAFCRSRSNRNPFLRSPPSPTTSHCERCRSVPFISTRSRCTSVLGVGGARPSSSRRCPRRCCRRWVAHCRRAGRAPRGHAARAHRRALRRDGGRDRPDHGPVDPARATGAEALEFVAGVEGVLAAQNDTWITTLEARS